MHAHPVFLDLGRAAAAGVQQPQSRPNELLEVLVPGYDNDLESVLDALARQRRNHVVGLVAIHGDHGHTIGVQQLADAIETAIEVGLKFLVQLLARRLVLTEDLVPEGRAGVVHPGDVVGLVFRLEALQEVDDAPGRGRVLSA